MRADPVGTFKGRVRAGAVYSPGEEIVELRGPGIDPGVIWFGASDSPARHAEEGLALWCVGG